MGENPFPQIITVEETILISEWILSQRGYQTYQTRGEKTGAGKARARLSKVTPNKYKPKPLLVHRQRPLHNSAMGGGQLAPPNQMEWVPYRVEGLCHYRNGRSIMDRWTREVPFNG